MYVVKYQGKFGFIKPWTAVRDGETFSQQFLTPSIIEGIEKKLFPDMLGVAGIHKIKRHKLKYDAMDSQQEVTQTRGWEHKNKMNIRNRSVLKRSVLLNPRLWLAFESHEDALSATRQHICLCRNEDMLIPEPDIMELTEREFEQLPGFELRFGESDQSFLVGYNRFSHNEPMYGWLEHDGISLLD